MQATQIDEESLTELSSTEEEDWPDQQVSCVKESLQASLDLERALSQFMIEEYPEEEEELANAHEEPELVPGSPDELAPPAAPAAPPEAPAPPPAAPAPPQAAPAAPPAAPPAESELTLQLAPERSMTDPAGWRQLWEQLESRGWSIVLGPRGDRYWMPPGVERRAPWQCRKHYFDSKKQVIRHLRDQGNVVVEVAGKETSKPSAPPACSDVKAVASKGKRKLVPVQEEPRLVRSKAMPVAKRPAAAMRRPAAFRRPAAAAAAPPPVRHGGAAEWETLWAELETKGWTLEVVGTRRDMYFLPPGVQRGPGKKHRVDYFDSKKQVIEYVQKCGNSEPSPVNGSPAVV